MESNETLPIANVGRIMKQILPERAKISKEGKQVMQECVTEFISFVTGEASDKCQKENRKTLNGDDISWALTSLGFDNYAEAITRYLYKYRQAEKHKLLLNNRNHNHNYNKFHDGGGDGGGGGGGARDDYEGSASRRRSKHGEEEQIECRVSTENHPTPPTNQLSICLSDED